MSATRQHHRWPELWNECRLLGYGLLKHGDKHVAVAHNVERRNGYRRSIKGGHELPAAVDIAPPVQGAAESDAGDKETDIDVYVAEFTFRPLRLRRRSGAGSVKRAPFRGTIPAANPPLADGGLSPESE